MLWPFPYFPKDGEKRFTPTLVREKTGISCTCHASVELLKFQHIAPGSESKGVIRRTCHVSSEVWVFI